jgi:hypothetical protein
MACRRVTGARPHPQSRRRTDSQFRKLIALALRSNTDDTGARRVGTSPSSIVTRDRAGRNRVRHRLAASVLAAGLCVAIVAGWLRRSDAEGARRYRARAIGAVLLADRGAVRQQGSKDCGPAALLRVLTLLGRHTTLAAVDERVRVEAWGASAAALVAAADLFDVEAIPGRVAMVEDLQPKWPAIALIDRHWIVIERKTPGGGFEIFDPSLGHLEVPGPVLARGWRGVVIRFAVR